MHSWVLFEHFKSISNTDQEYHIQNARNGLQIKLFASTNQASCRKHGQISSPGTVPSGHK